MKLPLALLVSALLIILAVIIGSVIKFDLAKFLILGTSLWAAWDSSRIELSKYKSGISVAMNISRRAATDEELNAFKETIASLIMFKG